ncbi:MAG: alpha-galactosidase [Eubacterium sp.]|nr:alpha-galactosidase [Eubacterium sp.]
MIVCKNNTIHLRTEKTSYIFFINDAGLPEHVYYGKRIGASDGSVNIDAIRERIGFAPGNTTSYSSDHPKLAPEAMSSEYAVNGRGDVREAAVTIKHSNGSVTSDFTYVTSGVFEGLGDAINDSPLPHSYDDSGKYEHLVVILKDKTYGETLELHYFVYPEEDVITRSVRVVNTADSSITVERLLSNCIELPTTALKVTGFRGSWAHEMNRCDNLLTGGKIVFESKQGGSGSRCNPFVMASAVNTSENYGEVYGFNLVYSGDHYSAFETSDYSKTRFVSGINPEHFSFVIKPGETMLSPEAVMSFSTDGYNGLSQNMHHFVKKHIVRGVWRDKERPILLNSWEAAYFDINESKLMKLAKVGRDCGIELFVMDDGWFGERNDDKHSLGDWTENKKKLPHGVAGLAEKINKLGMKFGIWVEPEMVNVDSELYRKHPEYTMEVPGKPHSEGRNQRVLDLANSEVVDYIESEMKRVFSAGRTSDSDKSAASGQNNSQRNGGKTGIIEYVKWDMNRIFSEVFSQSLPADRQGEVSHRYMLGLYTLLGRLIKDFPDILFEGCASGGNRFDLGMLCFFPQIWASDNTDAMCRLDIEKGYSYGYPMNTISSHVSGVPNHQTLRVTPIETRFNVAALGVLGYESNLADFTKEDLEAIKRQVETYKLWRRTLQFGDFYRGEAEALQQGAVMSGLTGMYSGSGNENIQSFTVVSQDKKEAIGVLVRRFAIPNSASLRFKASGLDEEGKYHFYNIKKDHNIKEFGDLINTATPIHVKQDGFIHNTISKFMHLSGEVEDALFSGNELMYVGAALTPSYAGTGYEDGTRLFSDYASRMYFIERI